MTAEEALKQKDTYPWLAYLGGTQAGRAFAQLLAGIASQLPTERELMLRGRPVVIPLALLPLELQQAAATAATGGIAPERRRRPSRPLQSLVIAQPGAWVMSWPCSAWVA